MNEVDVTPLGISVALLTPFRADGGIETSLLAEHALSVLAAGAHGVTLFGTTGEGASLGMADRQAGITALIDAGVPPAQIIVGVYGTSVADVAAQIAQAAGFGVRDFLTPPPFYFADASDDGLFDWFVQLGEATDEDIRFVLYHIPQVTRVPFSHDLVRRLVYRLGDRIRAIKDSSGDWENARALLESRLLPVLVGDERLLHRAARLGGAGSICGMANLHPARLRQVFETGEEDADLSAEVDRVLAGPVIPGVKVLLAKATGNPGWERVRPPLSAMTAEQRLALSGGAAEAGAKS